MKPPATATSVEGRPVVKAGSNATRGLHAERPSQDAAEKQTLLRLESDLANAEKDLAKAWQDFVQETSTGLLKAFSRLNGAVVIMVAVLAIEDAFLMFKWPPEAHYQRLITDKVIMALIAASAAQLGALAFSVGTQLLRLPSQRLPLARSKATGPTTSDADARARSDVSA